MSRYVFVPLTDEILYDRPELINGPIVPYIPGAPCHRWLSVELNPQDEPPAPKLARRPLLRLIKPHLVVHSH